jgi:hypothetical protein
VIISPLPPTCHQSCGFSHRRSFASLKSRTQGIPSQTTRSGVPAKQQWLPAPSPWFPPRSPCTLSSAVGPSPLAPDSLLHLNLSRFASETTQAIHQDTKSQVFSLVEKLLSCLGKIFEDCVQPGSGGRYTKVAREPLFVRALIAAEEAHGTVSVDPPATPAAVAAAVLHARLDVQKMLSETYVGFELALSDPSSGRPLGPDAPPAGPHTTGVDSFPFQLNLSCICAPRNPT